MVIRKIEMITYRVQITYWRKAMDPKMGLQVLDQMHVKANQQAATGISWGKLETEYTTNTDLMPKPVSKILKASGFYYDSFNLLYYKDHKIEGQAQQTMDWFEDEIRPWLIEQGELPEEEVKKIFSRLKVPHDELEKRDSW